MITTHPGPRRPCGRQTGRGMPGMLAGRRVVAVLSAVVVASWVLVGSGQPSGQAPLSLGPAQDSGQSVTGAYEGWFPNADGTFSLLVGYMNRNLKETLDIPVGSSNRIEPGGPDRGQPTHFLPRRQYGMFTVVVSKDFATTTRQLQWTIVANGHTTIIPLTLHADYHLDPFRDAVTGNTPPVLRFTKDGPRFQGPVKPLTAGGVGATYTGKVGQPVVLSVAVTDDMHAEPGDEMPLPGARPLVGPPPVSATWTKFRGPGLVTFKDAQPNVAHAGDGAATTAAVFSAPGEYVLRLAGNDASGEGGGGFQCCWTSAYAKVIVTR